VGVSFDWCEIPGTAFDDWRRALAEEVGPLRDGVMISCKHEHDAPLMDPEAEYLLREVDRSGAWRDLAAADSKDKIQMASACWPDFNRMCIQRARMALAEALKRRVTVTQYGIGKARVEGIASNRRFIKPDGMVSYGRMSRCTDPVARAAADREIDPFVRTLSFWAEEKRASRGRGLA
jgi:hypothetical protein